MNVKILISVISTIIKNAAKNISEKSLKQKEAGYSLTELTLVVLIIGIIAAIAAPGWLAFINNYRLRTSTDRIYQAMFAARRNAIRDKTAWQASFQETTNIIGQPVIRYALHKPAIAPNDLPTSSWKYLEPGIEIDDNQTNDKGKYETTLRIVKPDTNTVTTNKTDPIYRALFNYKGCPVYKPTDQCTQTSIQAKGRIGIKHQNQDKPKRCVIISTLLGVVRTGKDHAKALDGKYCY
ncbi:prepilin-type N-terminal cleavage/methylation domain-containing protein [Okeania hirsuta]|uniref:Prepilin-type N-terminal cleavage/methylation domain-containing protein n=1 Tax=Okeania hirsuta TaxID=1458930 RepID=A0A3N6Q0M1_9CYAN|nr:prepilin-type N-terminal cleavage/methylation domain-containing protein [Okeania hirsuta]RQH52728.1 prepilin-type N-terminal cleavage/methylation domain-containing protein [Okeania hirsuta]